METHSNNVSAPSGVVLEAHLTDDGKGVFMKLGDYPNQGEPQYLYILRAQLDNSPLTTEEKENFYQELARNRSAKIFLPRHTSSIRVWN